MNEEVKEILEALKPHNDIIKEYPLKLSIEEQKLLLDYITNLQEENETLKELNVCVGCKNNIDYKSRCEKAYELLKRYNDAENNYYVPVDEVINILGGKYE